MDIKLIRRLWDASRYWIIVLILILILLLVVLFVPSPLLREADFPEKQPVSTPPVPEEDYSHLSQPGQEEWFYSEEGGDL